VAACSRPGISSRFESRPVLELRFVQPASRSPTTSGFTNDCPGGAQEGSRGLSKAIPPEYRPKSTLNPGRGSRSAWIANRHTTTTLTPGNNHRRKPIPANDESTRGVSERWPGFTAWRLACPSCHHPEPCVLEPRSGFMRLYGCVPGVPLRGTPGYPLTPLRGRRAWN
jgi:hypothetical protein